MKARVIPTSDGRLIQIFEGVLRLPPKVKGKNTHTPRPNLGTRLNGAKVKSQVGATRLQGNGDWYSLRKKQGADASPERKGRILGHKIGMRRHEAEALMAAGYRRAALDMENIKKNFTFEDSAAEEAMLGALEVLRTPTSQQVKLQAAKLLLDFTKIKPVSKSEMTVNAAEKWLDSLEPEDTGDSEETEG